MNRTAKPVEGVWAALLIPRRPSGALDIKALAREVDFLRNQGLMRVVLNGATGEYIRVSRNDFRRALAVVQESIGEDGEFLCGIGAADFRSSVALGRRALQAGARAVLLPAPYFFPYSQDDLQCYFRAAARELGGTILLYNLPRFTTPIATETALALIGSSPFIAGIKDSSGSLAILRELTVRKGEHATRIVGDDSALEPALREGVCDGVISGVAGVLPELIMGLWRSAPLEQPALRLREFISWLSRFPVPWGLKWVAEWRGIAAAEFAWPLSEERRQAAKEFQKWFENWWPVVEKELRPAEVTR